MENLSLDEQCKIVVFLKLLMIFHLSQKNQQYDTYVQYFK